MKPIPVVFHLGPLQIHTYGIGLAITFYFAYRYFGKRLNSRGIRSDWLASFFVAEIIAAIVGARAMHVIATWKTYSHNLTQVFAIWHGGLSSFGGLIGAVPVGLFIIKRKAKDLSPGQALEIVAPVLAAAWSMGRLLGPQLMVAGGGHLTNQWFGMSYATQPGKRLPVPIFQAAEDFAIFLVLIYIEKKIAQRQAKATSVLPNGFVLGAGMVLWGIERVLDQRLWLSVRGQPGTHLVQIGGAVLFIGGLILLFVTFRRWKKSLNLSGVGPLEVGPLEDSVSEHDKTLVESS